MKNEITAVVFACILWISCEKEKAAVILEDTVIPRLTDTLPLPDILRIGTPYDVVVQQWKVFVELENEMKIFRKAVAAAYGVHIVELLRLEGALSETEFPEKFNIPAIKSRLVVFKTYLMQTKALLDEEIADDTALHAQKIKIIIAFNALKKQCVEALSEDITEELLKEIK